MSTFVDDIKVMGPKKSGYIEKVKSELGVVFEMVDIGLISFYLELKIKKTRQKQLLKLFQPAYIEKILEKYYLHLAKLCNIPMKEGILLPNKGPKASQAEQEQYQGITRSLMFSMVETRLDIAFTTLVISRFAKNLSRQYTEVVKTILQYLKTTKTVGITYGSNEKGDLTIRGYSDSNWAGDYATRKSSFSFIFMLNGGPVSWYSKR